MRNHRLVNVSLTCIAVAGASLVASWSARADIADEAVVRCHIQAGEWGNEMIDACVKAELEAAEAVLRYPEKDRMIVKRCAEGVEIKGWVSVKRCIDKDIAAANALSGYSERHQALIAQCNREMAKGGAARVKACVDEAIAAGEQREQK